MDMEQYYNDYLTIRLNFWFFPNNIFKLRNKKDIQSLIWGYELKLSKLIILHFFNLFFQY